MNLQEILREEYNKTIESIIDPNALLTMIEEIMEIQPDPLKEEVATAAGINYDPQQMLLKMIPDIAVSEIGWSDVRTVEDEGGETTMVSGPQRQLLEDYLSNIAGTNFEEKIASVAGFYEQGTTQLRETTQDRIQLITNAISYLVFYKTLTKIITNFNAASAGFSFESFLATLVNGRQIEANTGTIADYVDNSTGQEIPVSLKLYSESGLEVGGSYTDLINDLTEENKWPGFPNKMRYVVCTKTLEGEGLKQEGVIKFYQFDFTLDNVMDILLSTKFRSQGNIRLPKGVVHAILAGQQSGADVVLPERSPAPTDQDLEKIFLANLIKNLETIRNLENAAAVGSEIAHELEWAKNDSIFNKNKVRGSGTLVARGANSIGTWVNTNLDIILGDEAAELGDIHGQVTKAIMGANLSVIASQKASALADARNREIARMEKEGEFYSAEESAEEYKKMGPIQKRIALRNSYGIMKTGHFSLNKTEARNPAEPTNTVHLGEIKVGTKHVAIALNQVRDILNDEVSEIFQSLKILSDSLNSFFAGGLQDDSLAQTSIENAGNIQAKEILQPDE